MICSKCGKEEYNEAPFSICCSAIKVLKFIPETKTLRDEIAIAAMQAMILDTNNHNDHMTTLCEFAYKFADSMIEARNK